MSINNLVKLADKFEKKLQKIDPTITVEEHKGVDPVSYMAFSNLTNIVNDANELLSLF